MIRFKSFSLAPDFKAKSEKQFDQIQKRVDSEVLRYSDPYVPFLTGMMKKSGITGTVVGSGVVEYTAPHAKPQYYTNKGRGKEGINAASGVRGLRGPYFFERMKADHKDDIRKEAFKE